MTTHFLSGVVILVLTASAQANGPQCSDQFSPAKTISQQQSAISKRINPRFDTNVVRDTKAKFVAELKAGRFPDPSKLESTEQKIALIDAIAATNTGDVFNLATWLVTSTASQRRELRRSVNKFNFNKKSDWSKSEKAFVRLYLLTHINPGNAGLVAVMKQSGWSVSRFWQLFKTDWATEVIELQRHRAGLSLARRGMMKSFEEMGLVKSKSNLDILGQKLSRLSAPVDIAGSTMKSIVSFYFPLISTRTPRILLRQRDLPEATNLKLMQEGFGSIREEARRVYGNSAKVQAVLNRTERTLGKLMLPIMIGLIIYDFDDLKRMALSWMTDEEAELEEKERNTVLFTPEQREAIIKRAYETERNTRIRNIIPEEDNLPEDEKAFRLEGIDQQLHDEKFEDYLRSQSDPALERIAQAY